MTRIEQHELTYRMNNRLIGPTDQGQVLKAILGLETFRAGDVLMDRDGKFCPAFKDILENKGVNP